MGGKQRMALHISQIDPAAGFQCSGGSLKDAEEVFRVREILCHGIDDHRVEVGVGDSAEIIGGPVEEFDLGQRVFVLQRPDGDFGNVRGPIALRGGSHAREDLSGAAADFKDAVSTIRTDPLHRGVDPLGDLGVEVFNIGPTGDDRVQAIQVFATGLFDRGTV